MLTPPQSSLGYRDPLLTGFSFLFPRSKLSQDQHMAFVAGDKLGPYEIVEHIGKGGMGEVYKARDARLDRYVAIKILPNDKFRDESRKARFAQEARAASSLNHPNIITVYDIASEGEIDFIVMEFVPGKTLSQLIPRRGMRVGDVLRYSVQIADALSTAHAASIVHRDLKPSNIMVVESDGGRAGLVKVLDFGLAKLADRPLAPEEATLTITAAQPKTAEGTLVGTAAYMSPEQAEGKPLDARSDIFSFGVMLYEMLSGERAFERDSTLSTLSAVLREDPRPLETVGEVARVVNRCLRKDPAWRFQSTADLRIALDDLKREADSGSLAGAAPPAMRPQRRWPWAVAAFVVALAAAAALWYRVTVRDRAEEPLTAIPITSYPGNQMWPTFSPDGNQVAFTWQKEGETTEHLYVKLVGQGVPLQLTHGESSDTGPAWSPNGSTIAFLRRSADAVSLVTIPALGGPERVLSRWRDAGVVPYQTSWSPDGKWVLYSYRPDDGRPLVIGAIAPDSGETRKLTAEGTGAGDICPTLSPDGRTLAFARVHSMISDILLLPVTADLHPRGEPRQLAHQDATAWALTWHPSGQEILYSTGNPIQAFAAALWRVRISDGIPHRLQGIGSGLAPALSIPRGPLHLPRLAFALPLQDENLWTIRLSSGKASAPVRLVASTRQDYEPRYSADGSRIAFSSDRTGLSQVWLANADGSNQVQLTFMKGTTNSGARWSPDGTRLALLSTESGKQEIYMLDSAGGLPLRLTNDRVHDSAPSWSRDGKWIYFASNRDGKYQIWKIPPQANATPIRVTRNGGFASIESWDGKTLYYTQRVANGIWKMPVEGGEEKQIISDLNTWGDFDVTRDGIVLIASKPYEIRFYSFVTGKTTLVAALPRRPAFGLTVSPADGSIVYTLIDQESSEIMMVENFR